MQNTEYTSARLIADKIIEVSGFDQSKYKQVAQTIALPVIENELVAVYIDLMLGRHIFAKHPQSSFDNEKFTVEFEELAREDPEHFSQVQCDEIEKDSKENALYRIQMAIDECLDPYRALMASLKKYSVAIDVKFMDETRFTKSIAKEINDSFKETESILAGEYSDLSFLIASLVAAARDSTVCCRFVDKSALINAESLLESLFHLEMTNTEPHIKENYMASLYKAMRYLYKTVQDMQFEIAASIFAGNMGYIDFIDSCASYKIEQDMNE